MKKFVWSIIIVIIVLIIFFFPKSCGGGGGIGEDRTHVTCNCFGIKAPSLFNKYYRNSFSTWCYGICLKNTCETNTYP